MRTLCTAAADGLNSNPMDIAAVADTKTHDSLEIILNRATS